MKVVFLISFLCALLTVHSAHSDVVTDSPQFSITNATITPVKIEVKNSSNVSFYLPNNGTLTAGQKWSLTLAPTGRKSGKKTYYYELVSIKATATAANGQTIVGERMRNVSNTDEVNAGLSLAGSSDFYIASPSATSLQIIKLVQ